MFRLQVLFGHLRRPSRTTGHHVASCSNRSIILTAHRVVACWMPSLCGLDWTVFQPVTSQPSSGRNSPLMLRRQSLQLCIPLPIHYDLQLLNVRERTSEQMEAFSTMPPEAESCFWWSLCDGSNTKAFHQLSDHSITTSSQSEFIVRTGRQLQGAKSVQRLDLFLDCCLILHTFALDKHATISSCSA